jgi:hypothetical protein
MLRNASVLARAKGKRFAPRLRAPLTRTARDG